ncbi:hypothetical protein TWF106_004690 [Orbilia oligospora]|uniref:alcohol dehydrogenase (NADP(+)) n=1 Tax=Orbilia oligospora TaxID=2813651 RepID=A0A6G1M665_ORBOL|nr:hypothetical protein TWF788_006900 [Orbilia oligospora]KAF3202837.1 hypothetical protein TWF679_010623 [Orbilia oligospora]KAF3211843.1 hypothetical protein TWF191_010659 [Orbilia oligospora]KAF3224048.1 hypothetical protein TWF106_004690 [Orbilia oligospora]KAF3246930.1 hypothetical protein TWF192_006739 [Orbilia oligospora]
MVYPETFTAFKSPSAENWSDFQKQDFAPKKLDDNDVDIKIECCGICASDVHKISGQWGDTPYPLAVGHEIVGRVVGVGPKVSSVKVGQRVGMGAQCWSCGDCKQCKNDNETYCKFQKDTYGALQSDGTISQGGYSSHIRVHDFWVFPIPEKLASVDVAPMLCAGITVYSPLVRNGAGPGKKVGIVGIGGLGHFGIMFAKALGAEVWAISRSEAKKEDALKLGADGYIATGASENWAEEHEFSFDMIITTANSNENFDLGKYLSLLTVHGKFIMVGLAPGDGQKVSAFDLLGNGCFIGASHLGSRTEMLAMLDLAAEKGLKSWSETIPISEEGCKTGVTRLLKNDVRYRFVLTDYEKAFGQ